MTECYMRKDIAENIRDLKVYDHCGCPIQWKTTTARPVKAPIEEPKTESKPRQVRYEEPKAEPKKVSATKPKKVSYEQPKTTPRKVSYSEPKVEAKSKTVSYSELVKEAKARKVSYSEPVGTVKSTPVNKPRKVSYSEPVETVEVTPVKKARNIVYSEPIDAEIVEEIPVKKARQVTYVEPIEKPVAKVEEKVREPRRVVYSEPVKEIRQVIYEELTKEIVEEPSKVEHKETVEVVKPQKPSRDWSKVANTIGYFSAKTFKLTAKFLWTTTKIASKASLVLGKAMSKQIVKTTETINQKLIDYNNEQAQRRALPPAKEVNLLNQSKEETKVDLSNIKHIQRSKEPIDIPTASVKQKELQKEHR